MAKLKIKIIKVTSVIMLSSAVVFTALFCAPQKEIVIGFVASLSGMDYMLGVEGRNAAMLFVDELNASGGIDGRKLKLEIRDIASDDSRVPLVTRDLVNAGAVAIIGYYSSSSALAAIPVLQEALVPAICCPFRKRRHFLPHHYDLSTGPDSSCPANESRRPVPDSFHSRSLQQALLRNLSQRDCFRDNYCRSGLLQYFKRN